MWKATKRLLDLNEGFGLQADTACNYTKQDGNNTAPIWEYLNRVPASLPHRPEDWTTESSSWRLSSTESSPWKQWTGLWETSGLCLVLQDTGHLIYYHIGCEWDEASIWVSLWSVCCFRSITWIYNDQYCTFYACITGFKPITPLPSEEQINSSFPRYTFPQIPFYIPHQC